MNKIAKLLTTLLLLLVAGVANSKEVVIASVDYTTNPVTINGTAHSSEGYPWAKMSDCNDTASFDVVDGSLQIVNNSSEGNAWDLQPFIIDGFTVKEGYDYIVRIDYKTTVAGKVNIGFGTWDNSMAKYDVAITVADDYQTLEVNFNAATFASEGNNHVLWQCRKIVGTMNIKKVEVIEVVPDDLRPDVETVISSVDYATNPVTINGTANSSEGYPWHRMGDCGGTASFDVVDGSLQIVNNSSEGNVWDLQPFIIDGFTVKEGSNYIVRIDYKTTVAGNINIGFGEWEKNMAKYDVAITVADDYQTLEINFDNATFASAGESHVLWQCRSIVGTMNIKKVEIVEVTRPVGDDYFVVGTEALTGYDWNLSQNAMTLDESTGLYTWTAENIVVANDEALKFKVAKNSSWANAWPESDWVITPGVLGGKGIYDITITFNTETYDIGVSGVMQAEIYTVAGSEDLTGYDWDVTKNLMSLSETANIYTWTAENISVNDDSNFEFKIVKDGDWNTSWPSDNKVITAESLGGKGIYTITISFYPDDNANIVVSGEKTADIPDVYTVAGTKDLTGYDWNTEQNVMTLDESTGLYTWTAENITVTNDSKPEFKVVKNGSWTTAWPDKNWVITPDVVKGQGTYTITITFNPVTTDITVSVKAVKKSISDAGYATYCSPYALDFSSTGLTAYIATITGTVVSFTEVTTVPANNGVLLKGAAGDYSIPTGSSGELSAIQNALVGVLQDTPVAAGSFVLMNGAKGVGFYKTKNEFTVGANTAYLPALEDKARSFIGFDNIATGISEVKSSKTVNGNIYNLNGQVVNAPQKGLYIVNGKKVMFK